MNSVFLPLIILSVTSVCSLALNLYLALRSPRQQMFYTEAEPEEQPAQQPSLLTAALATLLIIAIVLAVMD